MESGLILKNSYLMKLLLVKTQIQKLFTLLKRGDNLTKIAKKYNTTWQSIYKKNKELIGDNPNLIKIGWHLKI